MKGITPLQFALLTSLADKPSHGYALVSAIEPVLGRRPGVATVYAALEQLVNSGRIVQSNDEVVDGRLRRHFAITQAGESVLAAEANEMARKAQHALYNLRRLSPVVVAT